MGAHRIAMRFRQARPPIIGRIKDDWFVLDARTIFDPLDLARIGLKYSTAPRRYCPVL